MKTIKYAGGSQVRPIVTAMVVSTPVLAQIAPLWDSKRGLFKDPWSNQIGDWCVAYYEQYEKAPRRAIQSLFSSWAETSHDKDTVKIVESYLESISDNYAKEAKQINPAYVIDQAAAYFTQVRARRVIEEAEQALEDGETDKLTKSFQEFNHVEVGRGAGIDVMRDRAAIKSVFQNAQEPLITLPGALGSFFGNQLRRGGFVVFEGPEKSGKTRWIMWLAWKAALQGKRVAVFQIGDLSQDEAMERFLTLAARRPFEATPDDEPIKYPTYIEPPKGEDDFATVDSFVEKSFKKRMSTKDAYKAMDKALGKINTDECLLRMYVYPNSTVSMADISAVVKNVERKGPPPDMVVIDYMDILAPPPGLMDSRDAINVNWKNGRRLSQSYHCLLLSATQTKASSYGVKNIGMEHYSDDKRKRAHTTANIAINRTDREIEDGITRLGFIVQRRGLTRKQVHCAGCPAIDHPCVISTF